MSEEVDNSDDEAPEAVSFGSSREEAIQVLKAAAEISKGTSHKRKKLQDEKRKRRQERKDKKATETSAQQIAKLNELREKAKEALFENQTTAVNTVPKEKPAKNSKRIFLEEAEETNNSDTNTSSDYIPFNNPKKVQKQTYRDINIPGANKLRVEVVSSKKPKVLAAESVLNFRETMLYGAGSKVRRESAKVVMARREKMKLSGRNVFCKN